MEAPLTGQSGTANAIASETRTTKNTWASLLVTHQHVTDWVRSTLRNDPEVNRPMRKLHFEQFCGQVNIRIWRIFTMSLILKYFENYTFPLKNSIKNEISSIKNDRMATMFNARALVLTWSAFKADRRSSWSRLMFSSFLFARSS